MYRHNKTLVSLIVLWLLVSASLLAGPKDPITGESFQKFVESQNNFIQINFDLGDMVSEKAGIIVAGPLDPNFSTDVEEINLLYNSPRFICADGSKMAEYAGAVSLNMIPITNDSFDYVIETISTPEGFRGAIIQLTLDTFSVTLQLQTINQLRWLIWAKQTLFNDENNHNREKLSKYALAVSDYLNEIDKGNLDAPEPKAVDFGLDESFDLYAPAPDYVIQGYQNYKDYLKSHAEIVTKKLSEILAFVPTESGLERLKEEAPDIAYPNKEFPLLQQEFRKFIRRGGKMDYMRTLTKEVFDTLKSAEYFFAVGMSGKVRFGRELLREEVKRIEAETGQKPARANHAFLFVGEPILTAGAFFIENDGDPKIVEVNTQSGHYFYSNITATIREDVAERSNEYFLTIGHFFRALDSLEIEYHNVLLRKL